MDVLILLMVIGFIIAVIGFEMLFVRAVDAIPINCLPKETVKTGFWLRQFQPVPSPNQRKFDWAFGVIMPVVCFAFDPVVFRGGDQFLGVIKPFTYLLSFTSVMAMMAWLIWGEKLKAFSGILAGFFALGGVISLAIGVVLFPFSLIGLIVLIGALGFTPLFTGIVFLRNARRAYAAAKPFWAGRQLIGASILSAMFAFVIPFTINMEINRLIDGMINGDVATIQRNARILKFVAPITSFNVLGRMSYRFKEVEPEKQQALSEAYEQLAGKDIERRLLGIID